MKTCLYCGKILTTEQRHNLYCSQACHTKHQKEQKINEWLNDNSTGAVANGALSKTIRQYLIEKANFSCEICGWNKKNPTTNLVPLEIHHIDGNYLNNTPANLQVLCPNCHSLTENYRSLNRLDDTSRIRATARKNYCIDCGEPISVDALRCRKCAAKYKVEPIYETRPDRDTLKQLIRTVSFVQIGKNYNVSDNAVKKWCIHYNLPSKKKEINKMSDEEWEKI